ncbi:MAG: hypothetical protein AB1505_01340 [Candidatus Latescibacterota bacterium]
MLAQTELESALHELGTAVRGLEARLLRLESHVGLSSEPTAGARLAAGVAAGPQAGQARPEVPSGGLEFEIGERWLGPVGVAVLLVGVAFLVYFPFGAGISPGLQVGIGYAVSALLLGLSRCRQARYSFTARAVLPAVLILAFLATLRLHFFTSTPVVASRGAGTALLVLAAAAVFWVAHRRRADHLAILALAMGLTAALCAHLSYASPALVLASALAAVWLVRRRGRILAILAALAMSYLALLLWLLNNPLVRQAASPLPEHRWDLAFALGVWLLFGVVHLFGEDTEAAGVGGPVLALGNGAGLFLLAGLLGVTELGAHQAAVCLLAAACCLALASATYLRRRGHLVTATYACLGYVALSLAIVIHLAGAARFIGLGWQSLLVVCTAIWFRSKVIVVANVAIYLSILLAYLFLEPPHLAANLSYAAVALLSARVMNWQKRRLELRTEAMRTTYLASAFVVIPYGLYHAVPPSFVGLSWVGAALFYFLMSMVLHNRKYRWMAILTMLLTVAYTFAVDLGRLDPGLRVTSLVVLGVALVVVSLAYARHRQRGGAHAAPPGLSTGPQPGSRQGFPDSP